MSPNRANWDDTTTKIFLDLCIIQKNLKNFNNLGLTNHGWQQVYRSFKEQTGLNFDKKKMQNKLNTLKRSFQHWQSLQTHTGLGCDSSTGAIAADDSFWGTQEGEPSTPQASRGKPPPFLEELYTLFGRTTHDKGNLITAGGVREPSPNYGSEDTPPYLSDDHVGCSNIRSSSKRPIREETVDSPPKKKMSLEEHIANISENISIRNRRTLSRAQQELDDVVRLLKEDGLGEETDLYCMALMLCNNELSRRAFLSMETKEGRLHWIRFNWANK